MIQCNLVYDICNLKRCIGGKISGCIINIFDGDDLRSLLSIINDN